MSVALCLVAIEAVASLFFNRVKADDRNNASVLSVGDEVLGWRSQANASEVDEAWLNGKLVYRARYTTNEHGRRIVPGAVSERRERFIALFGCSMTFGTGINDDETLAFHLARLAPDYMPYNFACPGYGTQHLLLTIQEPIEEEIDQKTGVGIYVYFVGHTRRLMGAAKVVGTWGASLPDMRLEDGNIVVKGPFAESRPWWVGFCRVTNKSRAIRLFRSALPDYTKNTLELTTRVILEARKEFQRKFPGSPFYVAIPYCWRDVHEHDQIAEFLKKNGIGVLRGDLTRDPNEPVEPLLAHAAHPSSLGNRKMAEFLVEQLNLNEPKPTPNKSSN